MGGKTANPAPHGPLRRTLSCHALIPLVLLVGGLAVGGALLVQGLARVGQRLRPQEPQLILAAVVLTLLGALPRIDFRWGLLVGIGLAVAPWLAPDAKDWGRLRALLPAPGVQRLIGWCVLAGLLIFGGQAIAQGKLAVLVCACLGLLLAASQTLARLEDRRPIFRPISVKHTK